MQVVIIKYCVLVYVGTQMIYYFLSSSVTLLRQPIRIAEVELAFLDTPIITQVNRCA